MEFQGQLQIHLSLGEFGSDESSMTDHHIE